MFCFNIPCRNRMQAADICFSKLNACPCWLLFSFSGLEIQPPQACFYFLFCFGAEILLERLFLRHVVKKTGCSRLLTLAHALLRICLHFAHGLLTLAHALLALCSARQGSFWILYIPIKSSRSSSWVLTRICAQCSRLAHGLLTVCPRCSRFAHPLGDEVFFLMKSHATFNLFRAMCT